ncbi:hypothetical protein K9M41_00455 [Candidatus Gracilibacteria bacterium]|nr:hypothetical protein [Candidatus Gracilibacteria bacterium]
MLICSILTPLTASPVEATLFGLFKDTDTVPKVERLKIVSLLVEEELLDKNFLEDRNLPEKIRRYAIDIQNKLNAKVVLVSVPSTASPLDIYEGNAHLYFSGTEPEGLAQLVGTVLVGDIPLPIVEKNGNFWPTIFPYLDFEDPVYQWDPAKERFVFQGGNHEPEIWHGWIRADSRINGGWDEKKLQEFKEDELISYFDDNHNYHDGTTTYDEKVFYADLPRQKEGLSDVLKERYDKWIEHIEDIAYLRYNKHWLEDVLDDSSDMSKIAWDFLDPDASPDEVPDLGESAKKMPDIHTKSILDNFVRRYFESWKNYLSLLNTRIGNAGRWDGGDIDTTISLVSTKDENAAVKLKNFNDDLETRLNTVLVANNIAENISILETPAGLPNYWNGISKADLTAEDCSLLRGSPRTTNHPIAQMVEANRSYNLSLINTTDSCLAGHSSCCAEDTIFDSGTFTMTNTDCNVANATLPIFDITGTTEKTSGDRGTEACDGLIIKPDGGGNPDDDFNEDITFVNRFDSLLYHVEPTAATISAQLDNIGTVAIPVDDPRGFSFYDHAKDFQRVDYFNAFDLRDQYLDLSLAEVSGADMLEISGGVYGALSQADVDVLPAEKKSELLDNLRRKLLRERLQTDIQAKISEINAIITAGNTASNDRLTTDRATQWPGTPCVKPGGYQCAIDPFDDDECREYTQTETTPETLTTKIVWEETCTWTKILDPLDTQVYTDSITRYYETATSVPDDVFDSLVDDEHLNQIAEALIWLDKDIAEKNRLVLEKAFSPVNEARDFFLDSTFHDGYELVEIVAEKAEASQDGNTGIKFAFEQGEDPDDAKFQEAKTKASLFSFKKDTTDSRKDTGLFGGDFAQKFLGQKQADGKARCEGMDIVGWFPCFLAWQVELPSFLDQKLFAISGLPKLEDLNPFDKLSKSKSNGPKVFSPFEKTTLDDVNSLKIEPEEVLISGTQTSPVDIIVSLVNKAGQVIESDFSTEVSLYFGTSDAAKFFRIHPAQNVKVISGKARFSLIPKTSEFGGKFSFAAETTEVKSKLIPITVTRNSLFTTIDKEEVIVKDKEGVLIKVSVQDFAGKLSLAEDDKELVFLSDWGTFSDSGRQKIKKGQAEIKFYADKVSGPGKIYIQDTERTLPKEELEIEVLPDKPAKLEFITKQNYLVKGAGFVPVEVQLLDQWGNLVENETAHTLTWKGTNLEIEGLEEGKLELKQEVSGRTAEIMVRPRVGSSVAKLEVTSDLFAEEETIILPKKEDGFLQKIIPKFLQNNLLFETEETPKLEELEHDITVDDGDKAGPAGHAFGELEEVIESEQNSRFIKNFIVPEKAILNSVITSDSITVGEETPIQISLKAETIGGNQINGSFEVQISTEPKDLGHFPAKVNLEEGLGQFDIFSGTRSGEVKVTLTSLGFEERSFVIDIQPGEPKKILISSEKNTIDVDDPHSDIMVDIKVVDEFGNIATSFIDAVYLSPNEPDLLVQSDREELIDLGVFDKADPRYVGLANQGSTERALGTSPDDSLVTIESNGKIYMSNGIGEARVSARTTNTGKVFLTAKAEAEYDLIPDALEFEITKFLTVEEVEDLTPKSLTALILGFDSGDLIADKNFANRFLHVGETQSVGALLTPPHPKKVLGYLTPQGEIINDLELELDYGEFFETKFLVEDRWVVTGRVLFQNGKTEKKDNKEVKEVSFTVGNKKESPGWYFVPDGEKELELTEKNRMLYYNMLPVLSVSNQGGIAVQNGGVDFRNKAGSLLEWEVYLLDEKLGDLVAVLDEKKTLVMTESEMKDRTDGGIFIIRQSADIRIKEAFVGKTTNDERGLVFVSATEEEEASKILGSPKLSAEDVQDDENIVWNSAWKPGAFFAAGNSIGKSVQWGSSDNFILLGDPTVNVPTENTRSSLLLTPDLGEQLWKTPNSLPIDQILVADLNGDSNPDILNLVGDELHALYQDDTATDNFRHTGSIIRFADGVREEVIELDNDWDGFSDLIHLNDQGKLVFHRNTNGTFAREKFVIEGVDSPITKVLSGNINNDNYLTDLVFADELRNLWVGFGTEDSGVFRPIYKIGNFGPSFAKIEEDFSVAEQQDPERWYIKKNDFEYLDQFLVSFTGIKNEIDEVVTPKEVIFAIENPNSSKKEDIRTFLTVPYNGEIDVQLQITSEKTTLEAGDELVVEFTFDAGQDISDLELIVPDLNGFQIVPDSLSCEDCSQEPQIYNSQEEGALWIYGLNLEKRRPVTLSWKLQATSFADLDFLVFDFQGNDKIDDIAIPQTLADGTHNFVQYVSIAENKAVKKLSWLHNMTKKLTAAFLGDPNEDEEGNEFLHSKQVDGFTPPATPDPTDGKSGGDLYRKMLYPYQNDSNADGLPDLYEGFGDLDFMFGCGGCGLPIPSIAFLAPGSQALYVPPFSVPLPSFGFPIFWIGPSLPIVYSAAGPPTSFFRIYVMPTTTAQVGLSICLGPQTSFLVPPAWIPNCFVVVPPLLEMLGACPANGGGGSEGTISPEDLMRIAQEDAAEQESFNKKDKDGNTVMKDGKPVRETKKDKKKRLVLPKISNLKSSAADIISEWKDQQFQEVQQYKLPIIKLIVPKIPFVPEFDATTQARGGDIGVESKGSLLSAGGKEQTIRDDANFVEKGLDELGFYESPWVTVSRREFKIPYPVIPGEQFAEWEIQYEEQKKKIEEFFDYGWKDKWEAIKEELNDKWESFIKKEEREEFSKRHKEACEYGDDDTCYEFWREQPFLHDFLVSIEDNQKAWEQNKIAFEKNKEALNSYKKIPEEYKKFKERLWRQVEQFKELKDIFDGYFSGWLETNGKVIDQWKSFIAYLRELFGSWNKINNPFKDFKLKCPTCAVNRGSSTEWMMRLLVGSIKLPVIPMPKLPNIILDFTRLSFALDVEVPDMTFEKVDLTLGDIPDFTGFFDFNIDWTVGSPKIPPLKIMPVIPVLPSIPSISFDIPVPSISLPVLPVLIGPPIIPDILAPFKKIIALIKKLLDLFCMIVGGITPVPEWYLAGYVQQLTNRTLLYGLDFITPALSPVVKFEKEFDDVEIVLEANIQMPTGVFEVVNIALEEVQKKAECVVDTLSQLAKGNLFPDPCDGGGQSISLDLPDSYLVDITAREKEIGEEPEGETRTVVYDFSEQDGVLDESQRLMVQNSHKEIEGLLASLRQPDELPIVEGHKIFSHLASLMEKPKVYASHLTNTWKRWLTSTKDIDISQIPSEIPSYLDVDGLEEDQSQYAVQKPNMYYYDGTTGAIEELTDFPVEGPMTHTQGDISTDGTGTDPDEILFALNDELMLKYRTVPTFSEPAHKNQQREMRYKDHYDEEYDDRLSLIWEMDWKTFKDKFVPAKEVISIVETTGNSFEFERLDKDLTYFEWVIFDRPDHIFETDLDHEKRKALLWDRQAFLLRDESKMYEIRPMTTRVKKVKGAPILYMSPTEEIPLFSQEDCQNKEVVKPFFATESVLVGTGGKSRMEIRVPPRGERPEEFEEIILHEGEETIVEYAEVCLTRGTVERVSSTELEKVTPRKNLYLPTGSRLELGPNDEVELVLFDGTEVTVLGNEKYSLRFFSKEEERIEHFRNLQQKNYYGEFRAFSKDGSSYHIEKFLHDPQSGDDESSPQIKIIGGNKIKAALLQKVHIDATPTFDEQGIEKVWWDLRPTVDMDSNGDSTDDQDFPSVKMNDPVRNLLEVYLPAYEKVGTYSVFLNVEDKEGNFSQEEIEIEVEVPDLSLFEASLRSRRVAGKVVSGQQGVPINIFRKRGENKVWDLLQKNDIESQSQGTFEITSLSLTGGIEVRDEKKNIVAEILPTGRPVILDERFKVRVRSASNANSFQVEVYDDESPTQLAVAVISFTTKAVDVVVIDRNEEDEFVFLPIEKNDNFMGSVGLLDTETGDTLGILDEYGDFYLAPKVDITFQIKRAINETDSLVFEIVYLGKVIGEFEGGEMEDIGLKNNMLQGKTYGNSKIYPLRIFSSCNIRSYNRRNGK